MHKIMHTICKEFLGLLSELLYCNLLCVVIWCECTVFEGFFQHYMKHSSEAGEENCGSVSGILLVHFTYH